MEKILEKIEAFQKMIENNEVDMAKLESKEVDYYDVSEDGEIFIDLEFHDVDINEMIQLAYQQNLKGNLDKYDAVPSYYSLSWDVTENLSVLFWSKKNQEPAINNLK